MNQIKAIRESRGLTQNEAAMKLDIDNSTISKWETGESLPRAATLIRLAEVLGCTVDELLKDA